MEFTLPSPLGAQATLAAQQPARQAPDPARVEKAPKAGKARADAHNASDHSNAQTLNSNQKRDGIEPPLDPEQPVGPPPTFQMNVLEMERELHQRLTQLEISRSLGDQPPLQTPEPTHEDPAEQIPDAVDQDKI